MRRALRTSCLGVLALWLASCATSRRDAVVYAPEDVRLRVLRAADEPLQPPSVARPGSSPTIETRAAPVSAFAPGFDADGYARALAALDTGRWPDAAAVHVEDFINAPRSGVSAAGAPLTFEAEAWPSPWRPGFHLLRLQVRLRPPEARPRHIVFVVDPSPRVAPHLGAVTEAALAMASRLGAHDTVSIITAGVTPRVLVNAIPARDEVSLGQSLRAVVREQRSDTAAGVRAAWALPGEAPRVVVFTGDSVGLDALVDEAARSAGGLSVVGVGGVDEVMARVAAAGCGEVLTLGDAAQAAEEPRACAVRFEVAFDAAAVERYRRLGNDAGSSGASGVIGPSGEFTALFEVQLGASAQRSATLATFRAAFRHPRQSAMERFEASITPTVVRDGYGAVSPEARLTEVLAGFAEKLRGAHWVQGLGWAQLSSMAGALPAATATGFDVPALRQAVQRAAALDAGRHHDDASPALDGLRVLEGDR